MPTLLATLASLLAVTTAALAQSRATAPHAAERPFPVRAAHGVGVAADGTAWAAGHDYKAAFAAGAMTFVPALGTAAPTTRSLTFRLLDVVCGATPLALPTTTADAVATVLADRRRVQYTRGPLLERYDARPDGLEQSFVFAERPAGDGDLLVRGSITTTLTAHRGDDGTLRFLDVSGGVTLGGVTGIDADGRRCAGSLHHDAASGTLTLRLPAAFVAAASYPLVLDPLFATALAVGSTSFDDAEGDAAYDRDTDTYLVVWTRTFAATDQDVRAHRYASDGTSLGGLIAITSITGVAQAPTVADVDARNRFVVAWQQGPSLFGPFDIRACSVDAATGAVAAAIDVANGAGSEMLPAICGERSGLGTTVLVAFGENNVGLSIRSVTVGSTGVLVAGTTNLIATVGTLMGPPELPKSRAPGDVVVVTWLSSFGLPLLRANVLDYAGTPLGAPVTVQAVGLSYSHGMDGDGSQWLVAYTTPPSPQVFARQLQWNGSTLLVGAATVVATPSVPGDLEVGYLGDRHLVAWTDATANPFDGEVHALVVRPDCTACGVPFVLPTVARPNQRAPAIAPMFAGGGTASQALLVWDETGAAPPFDGSVVGQPFTAMLGSAPVVLGPSCSGGGTAGTDGPFALGNTGFRLTLGGGDPAAPLALLLLGDGTGAPIQCGCSFTSPLVTEVALATGGAADHPLGIPCDPLLLGFALEYQWLLFGASASPCPLLPNMVASDRVRLVLGQ